VDRSAYPASISRDGDALLAAAALGLDAAVPTCPGWSVERLVGHMGRVFRWTAGWVAAGAAPEVERPPSGEAVQAWTRAGLDQLLDALEEAATGERSSAATVATWAGDQPPIFWPRRMAIETALHRFDAESAHGHGRPITTALALAAIDELFEVLLPWRGTSGLDPGGETLHLHATDVEAGQGEWLITLGADGIAVEHAHAKGDVAVRGTASDLLLLLWNRVPADRFEVFGDQGLLDRWRDAVQL
jgi:uncharacterized protein (TIGR03083 family)